MTSLDVLFVVFMKFSSLLLFPFEKPAAPFVHQTAAYLRQYHVHDTRVKRSEVRRKLACRRIFDLGTRQKHE
jgi:hypothetical protein